MRWSKTIERSTCAGVFARASAGAFLLFAAVTLAGCDFGSGCSGKECVKGSGEVVTQTRQVGPFSAIRLETTGDLTVEHTGADTVTVETDDNLQPLVTSDVKDGTLVLAGCQNGWTWEWPSRRETTPPSCSPTKIVFKVTVGDLRKFDLRGTGSADVLAISGVG
jgi:hypothetical protein